MKFLTEKRDLLLDITGNLFVLGFVLLFLHHLDLVIVSIWIDISLLTLVTFASGFSWFFLFIQKDEAHFKAKTEPYFRNLFLAGLVLVTIGSFTFDFIKTNQILNSIVSFISSIKFYLVLATIGFGFFTFYFNRERIEAESILEKEQEEKAEKKREEEFDKKFTYLTRFDLDYAISENWNRKNYSGLAFRVLIAPFVWIARFPYSSVRWMYREGWIYSAGFILVSSLFFCIRFISPLIYQTNVPDEFFHMASAKSLLETGEFAHIYHNGVYKRGAVISFLTYIMFSLFGISFYSAKLVPIMLSVVNLLIIFKIIQKLNFNKNLILLFLLAYTLNPLSIFNHYTLRMYILYETLIITIIYLLINLNRSLEILNIKISFAYLLLILCINCVNWIGMYDTGKYVLPIATFLGIIEIYICNRNIPVLICQVKKLSYIGVFTSKQQNRILTSIIVITIGILLNLNKIKFVVYATHYPPTPFDYWNLFFEYFLLLTIFGIISIIIIQFNKNIDLKIISLILLILALLHLYSSLEIHHWRAIAYLIPVYLIIVFYGINVVGMIIKKNTKSINSKHISKICYMILLVLIISSSYTSIVPKNYIDIGPTIPEYNYIPFQTNMVKTSEFINDNFDDSYIIIESIRGYNLPSPKIYNISIDYKLDLKQNKRKLNENDSQRSWFIDRNGLVKPIYMNTPVITSIEMLENISSNTQTVIILSEEAINGNNLFEQEHLDYIQSACPNRINFTGIRVYWSE